MPDEQSEQVLQHLSCCARCEAAAETLEGRADSFIAHIRGPRHEQDDDIQREYRQVERRLKSLSLVGAMAGAASGGTAHLDSNTLDVQSLDYSPDAERIAVTSRRGRQTGFLRGDGGYVNRVGFGKELTGFSWAPDSHRYAMCLGTAMQLVHIDGTTEPRLSGHKYKVWGVDWHPDGRRELLRHSEFLERVEANGGLSAERSR